MAVNLRADDLTKADAYRWTEESGLEILPKLDGYPFSSVREITPDGKWIFGQSWRNFNHVNTPNPSISNFVPWLWSDDTSLVNLYDVFESQGISASLEGWQILWWGGAHQGRISADGRAIIGTGINPDGVLEGWVAYLDPITAEPTLPGDYNASGVVEQADLDLVLLNWGSTAVPQSWLNDLPSGAIDQQELDKVLLGWGTGTSLPAANASVPEPTTFAALGILTLISRRVRFWKTTRRKPVRTKSNVRFLESSPKILSICVACVALSSHARAATFQGLGFAGVRKISGDGVVVVGEDGGNGFRWTESSGITYLHAPAGETATVRGVSHDGSVIVGGLFTERASGGFLFQPARWTEETGWENPFSTDIFPLDVSADGSVVVGRRAVRWTAPEGATNLLDGSSVEALHVSDDGSVVVGDRTPLPNQSIAPITWHWTAEIGAVDLVAPPELNLFQYADPAMSADGRVIAGYAQQFIDGVCCRDSVFRWTAETGLVLLPHPSGMLPAPAAARWLGFDVAAISGNGDVIVGGRRPNDFIWDANQGTRFLINAMALEHGLGLHLAGWENLSPVDISTDGRTIVGNGTNPQHQTEAWIIRLDEPGGPPPNDGLVELRGVPVTSAELGETGELISFIAGGSSYAQSDLIRPALTAFFGYPLRDTVVVPTGVAVPADGERAALLTDDFQLNTGVTNPVTRPDAASLSFSPPLVNGPGADLVVFELSTWGGPESFQIRVGDQTGLIGAWSWGPQLGFVTIDTYMSDSGITASLSDLQNASFTANEGLIEVAYNGVAIDLSELGVAPMAEVSKIDFGSIGTNFTFDPVLFMGINSVKFLLGDYNANGSIDQADLDLVLLNWGRTAVPQSWLSDLPSGAIDQQELDKVLLGWGNTPPKVAAPIPSVPEPTTVFTGLVLLVHCFARGTSWSGTN